MKKIIQSFVFVILVITSLAFAQNDNAAIRLGKLLSKFQTYQAKFNQITYNNKGTVIQKTHGRVLIKRPGGFRWETDTPTKQIIVIYGKILWTYDVALQQATKRSLDQKANINPSSLLSGSVSDLMNQFSVTMLPGQTGTFILKPKKQSRVNFKSMQLQFKKGHLNNMRVVNNLDETSVFSFSHIRLNAPLSLNLFQFKPPSGVDVVSQ